MSDQPLVARLLDIKSAAAYLGGISTWTVRGLVADGVLRPVRIPSTKRQGEASRRLLFDRSDLDEFIEKSKAAR